MILVTFKLSMFLTTKVWVRAVGVCAAPWQIHTLKYLEMKMESGQAGPSGPKLGQPGPNQGQMELNGAERAKYNFYEMKISYFATQALRQKWAKPRHEKSGSWFLKHVSEHSEGSSKLAGFFAENICNIA